jgi:antitoxin (DNA-binding transcriptional repressor) of toxin-antitoxin stability system
LGSNHTDFSLAILVKEAYNIVRQTSLVSLVREMEVSIMIQVNILEAKTDLSKLIRLLETKREDYITVARNGKPVVKMTLINETPVSKRIGAGKGKFTIKGDFDADNEEIAELFMGGAL